MLDVLERLRSTAPSQHGRRWRSLACVPTRGEWRLREFLLRNLLVGISHIVVVDDNRLGSRADNNISSLLRPLVAMGRVNNVASQEPSLLGHGSHPRRLW